jgi:hypothetical protein
MAAVPDGCQNNAGLSSMRTNYVHLYTHVVADPTASGEDLAYDYMQRELAKAGGLDAERAEKLCSWAHRMRVGMTTIRKSCSSASSGTSSPGRPTSPISPP